MDLRSAAALYISNNIGDFHIKVIQNIEAIGSWNVEPSVPGHRGNRRFSDLAPCQGVLLKGSIRIKPEFSGVSVLSGEENRVFSGERRS